MKKPNKFIMASVLLITVLGIIFAIFSRKYYRIAEESFFSTLSDITLLVAQEMEADVRSEGEYLKFIAARLGEMDLAEPREAEELLSSFQGAGMLGRLELLLPDGRRPNGTGSEAEAGLSFEAEAALGEHISGREPDPLKEGKWILRYYVPVEQKGKTAALLCGVMELEKLEERYFPSLFDETAQLCLVDGSTGDFYADTWHKTLGNVNDIGERQVKDGFSMEMLNSDLAAGKSGSIVFRSQKADTYFYAYYKPVGVDDWMLMVFVPEDAAFGRARSMRIVSFHLTVMEIIVFLLYFLWILSVVKKESQRKVNELDRVSYLFEVEKALFDAHRQPDQIEKALERIAGAMTAGFAFLLVTNGKEAEESHVFTGEPERYPPDWKERLFSEAASLCETIPKEERSLIIRRPDRAGFKLHGFKRFGRKQRETKEALEKEGLAYTADSLFLTPLKNMDGEPAGILGVCDTGQEFADAGRLECVSGCFSMFLSNRQVYSEMRDMGMIDSLTGLFNRNSYHAALAELKNRTFESFACIYLDANGLHEINNHLGHEAGDKMLRLVADVLKRSFPENRNYRIGGDEFVIFCADLAQEEVNARMEAAKKALTKSHYSISYGIEWRDSRFDWNAIVRSAEEKMQQDKRSFYQKKGDLRKIREMNHELEKMLLEKQDTDVFLSVIASGFLGVYIVNMSADSVRHIFIPPYFEEMLKNSDGKYSEAILMYARQKIEPEYFREFREFCDYTFLRKQFEQGNVPEFLYRRVDGVWLRLRVFRFESFTEEVQETLWIFESADPAEKGMEI